MFIKALTPLTGLFCTFLKSALVLYIWMGS